VRYLVVVSDSDPVARAVAERWGVPPTSDARVDGTPIRWLTREVGLLRRRPLHLHDDRLDSRLPIAELGGPFPLVFPSIHASETGPTCFTVHPLGNPGESAELGGRPRTLVPTAPRLMTGALRRLAEAGRSLGLPATFEATHHGPYLEAPAFFVELGGGSAPDHPDPEPIAHLATSLLDLPEDGNDTPVVGIGGGHYAPHFTDLALRRAWAFGHILSRHALPGLDPAVALQARDRTPGAAGILYAAARDASLPALRDIGPRRADSEAPKRPGAGEAIRPPSGRPSPASGT
jgi:D-tyrosyl-tRNA(Tyr) deacylase